MLTLPIKQEWFDMICRGEKREEYREATEYYRTRINSAIVADPNCKGQAYKIFPVKIRAGYNSKAPAAILRVHCIFGKGGVREWGADPDKYYYILQILRIESIENWKGGNIPAERLRCETCLYWEDFNGVCRDAPGYIVHHKVWLTPENITDPDIALNPANFLYVCHDCHNKIENDGGNLYYFDENGQPQPADKANASGATPP